MPPFTTYLLEEKIKDQVKADSYQSTPFVIPSLNISSHPSDSCDWDGVRVRESGILENLVENITSSCFRSSLSFFYWPGRSGQLLAPHTRLGLVARLEL